MNENDQIPPPVSPEPEVVNPSDIVVDSEQRTWAMLGHLSAFSAFITGIGCVLGPLIVWLIKRDTMAFAGEQAREALNFNITVAIVMVALWIFAIITLGIGLLIVLPLGFVLFIAWLVLTIVAALKANAGENYRYPFTWRLVK